MAKPVDRVGELIEKGNAGRRSKALTTPEGVDLDIRIAGLGERLVAFSIDLALLLGATLVLQLLAGLLFPALKASVALTVLLFIAFMLRIAYFPHFELTSQGRTPGKKMCNLRVINREGGELTPSAVIARNLTREVEFFLPLSLLLGLDASGGFWRQTTLVVWVLLLASLPLWNRDRLRMGDLIAGTQVIALPRRVLLGDLSLGKTAAWTDESWRGAVWTEAATETGTKGGARFTFTPEQLAIYGAFELQVLEELLRRPRAAETEALLAEVCGKIARKIGWREQVPPKHIRRFLTDFYTAERAVLERGQLFGKLRADKTGAAAEGQGGR